MFVIEQLSVGTFYHAASYDSSCISCCNISRGHIHCIPPIRCCLIRAFRSGHSICCGLPHFLHSSSVQSKKTLNRESLTSSVALPCCCWQERFIHCCGCVVATALHTRGINTKNERKERKEEGFSDLHTTTLFTTRTVLQIVVKQPIA